MMSVAEQAAVWSIASAEECLVLADKAETRGHMPEARLWARKAGEAYLMAAKNMRGVSLEKSIGLAKQAATAFLRGMSRKKVESCRMLATQWANGVQ